MGVKNVQITVLIENTKNKTKPKLKAKHGLSFLITATIDDKTATILMDTGPSPDALLHNADVLGAQLQNVDAVVLSHGHYDHTGGLLAALERIEKIVPVVAHPKSFETKLSMMPHLRFIGAPFKTRDIEKAGGAPVLVKDALLIAESITTTGEVPRITSFEKVEGFSLVENESLQNDDMVDDQSLVINVENKGLVIIAGCAHSGIINTIKHAQKLTKTDKIYAVLGGFHLISGNDKKIQSTVEELKQFDPKLVAPCHCTGKKATKKIAEAFGKRCRVLCTGDIVEL
ncbi:MAG: MBL fold metallo-hydrolase [Candidatus Bathyarchaeota archaeon]|nr:MBL fold metallo-hydrolase [Candidatus Bathyarchaeota archaeon]